MKILHTITRGSGGGTMGALQKSISYERDLGHEVWLASGNVHNSDVNHLYVRHLKREISLLEDIRALFELQRILSRLSPDIVHSHESKAGALTRMLCYVFKSPVYVHTVHMATFHSKKNSFSGMVFSRIERFLAQKTDFLIFVSPALKGIFDAKKIMPRISSLVIRSRVDIEKFAGRKALRTQDHHKVTAQLGLPDSSKIILSVGLLEPRKRPEYILTELASIITKDSSVFLVFLGEGALRQRLELLAIELNVSSNVRFLGFKSDVEMWVAGSDVVALASVFEGFPQIALQSAAAGTPIVATQIEEYLGSTLFRIISSGESMADEIYKILSCTYSNAADENPELNHWKTTEIDADHKNLLDLISDCTRERE